MTAARILWGIYLTLIAIAVACLLGLVLTGSDTYLASGLMACLAAWFVTEPLDDARITARIQSRSAS